MRLRTLLSCVLLLPCFLQSPALAQDYPNRAVRILVPYGPGGATDIIARIVAARLTEALGQSFLVENRPGANGNLALEAAAKAPPDGYTLLVGNVSTNAINENTFAEQLKIKPSRDLVGIAKLVEIPHIVVASASFPANNIAELVALAKKEPGKINFASVGMGSYPHLDAERLMKAAGIQMTHVPYKGEPPALQDLLAGRIQVMFMAAAQPVVESGKARALGTTSLEPWFTLPNVAPLDKAGLPGFKFYGWNGLTVKAGTPPAVVARLNAAANEALQSPRVRKVLMDAGFMPAGGPPEKMGQTIRDDLAAYQKLIRDANLKF